VYSLDVDFGEFSKEYFIHVYGKRVGILLIYNNSFLFVRQYRFLIDRLSLEIPGGGVEGGETPQQAIVRECREETGIVCYEPQPLINYQQSVDTIYTPTYLFYTDKFEDTETFRPNPKEVVSLEWVPINQCLGLIQKGEIADSFSVIAILSYFSFQIHSQRSVRG
jgi:ADP-ribose pyrophosphatase